MGEPKHLLQHRDTGETLLAYQMARWENGPFSERFVVHREVRDENSRGSWTPLCDHPEFSGQGPLAAVHAALKACQSEKLAILAVDYPELPESLLLSLAKGEAEWTTVCDAQNRPQWLCSVLRRGVLPKLEQALRAGVRSVQCFAPSVLLERRPYPSGSSPLAFQNLNAPEDLLGSRFESRARR